MTMRGAHYTCPNDTVMTNKWHSATAVTNLCPTITYLAPAAITNYISQTRRPGVRKPGSLSPKKGCFLFHNSDFCSRKLTLISHGFSQLWSGEGTGECQRFSTFGLIFICHISSPCELGRKEKSIFLTYSEVHPLGYCPPSHCQCTFQFRLWTYNLSVWVILHKYDPRSYCYLHIPTSHFSVIQISSLLFSNILN